MTKRSRRFTLDCLVAEDGKVLVQVMVPLEESHRIGGDQRDAIWTATFQNPALVAETDLTAEDAGATGIGWSPESEDPSAQFGRVLGRVISMQPRGPDQLSIILHLALHNLLEAARKALKEE